MTHALHTANVRTVRQIAESRTLWAEHWATCPGSITADFDRLSIDQRIALIDAGGDYTLAGLPAPIPHG